MNISENHSLDEASKSLIIELLDQVLGSRLFSGSPRQQRFLKYLVEHTLNGHGEHLKGYTIGMDVFDRTYEFDPSVDSIVRVEAGRLRSKLREYYETQGREDTVRFDFPKGRYAIEISFLNNEAVHAVVAGAELKTLGKLGYKIGDKPSLAVLPFANNSADASHAYFADGITDNLIFELSNISGLFLISRQSSFAYRGCLLRGDEIGIQLGVRYLLEGGVQRVENRVRITVQLSDTMTGRSLWMERYDREFVDIFDLQDEITHAVVNMLQIKLTRAELDMFGHEGTVSIDAYDSLMRGLEQYWKYTPNSVANAIEYFNLAIRQDSSYATARAWLSRAMAFEWIMCWKDGEDILESAYSQARIALQLNQYLPHAYLILGWVQLWRKNGQDAIAACRKGVSLDPNNADGYMFLSMCLSCSGLGEEALHYMEMGMRLSPNPNPFHLYVLGQAYYVLGNYEQAISAMERGAEMSAHFMPNHFFLALLYTLQGRVEDCNKKRDQIYATMGGRCAPVRPAWIDSALAARHQELVRKSGLDFS